MPTNVLLTPTLYTKLVLMNLGDSLFVTRNMSSDYSKQFGNKDQKAGPNYNVRKPQRFIGTDNITYTPEAITDTSVQITVDKTSGVHFEIDALNKTLSLNEANNLAKPAALAIAAKVNSRAAKYIAQNTYNVVGTPGTIPSSMLTYLTAEDKLIQLGMPANESVKCIINRRMSSAFVDGSKALFNSPQVIGDQQKQGRVVNQLGYEFLLDQTLYVHTTGAGTAMALKVNGANQTTTGGNNANGTLNIKGATASSAIAKAGDVFTLTGVYSVHPQTQATTQDLQQFVILADATADGSGNATLSIFPSITPVDGVNQYANVTAAPADSSVITLWDGTSATASKVSTQGLLMHRDAFAFLSVPLDAPDSSGVEGVSQQTDPDTGISIRFVRAWDQTNAKHTNRFDILYGFGRLYPELACRIAS